MREGITALSVTLQEWLADGDPIPEVDWGKMRSLDFQETLRRRNAVWERNSDRECLQCPDFSRHVGPADNGLHSAHLFNF